MYYFCSLCGSDREDPKNWINQSILPDHLFKVHNHRLRTLEEIQKDWGAIGLIEMRGPEELPSGENKNVLKLPSKRY